MTLVGLAKLCQDFGLTARLVFGRGTFGARFIELDNVQFQDTAEVVAALTNAGANLLDRPLVLEPEGDAAHLHGMLDGFNLIVGICRPHGTHTVEPR